MAEVRITKSRWRELAAAKKQAADEVTEAFAALITSLAADEARYRTGALKRSVAVADGMDGAWMAQRRIVVGMNYGKFQEQGTKYMSAHAYLVPAVDNYRAAYLAAIGMAVSGGW